MRLLEAMVFEIALRIILIETLWISNSCRSTDGYRRNVLWVETKRSNNHPEITARLYLECVKERGFCPLQTRTDCGTENGVIAVCSATFGQKTMRLILGSLPMSLEHQPEIKE